LSRCHAASIKTALQLGLLGVIRGGAFRLRRIPVSKMPPITTKELQRREWSQRARSGPLRRKISCLLYPPKASRASGEA
jgi:hypothetical protein